MTVGASGARSWSRHCGGPDAFAELVFADEDAARLLARVRAVGLTGFERRTLPGPMTSQFSETVDVAELDVYAESERVGKIFGALQGGGENVWSYRVVMVGGSRVWIEDGFMAEAPELVSAEVTLMESLARDATLSLRRWAIRSGGQGYGIETVVEGNDAASLLTYLAAAEDGRIVRR